MTAGTMTLSGSALRCRYKGETNEAGQRHGEGAYAFPNDYYAYYGTVCDIRNDKDARDNITFFVVCLVILSHRQMRTDK